MPSEDGRCNRRDFIQTVGLGAAALGACARARLADAEPPERKPNIVFIFSDQQHWQALGGIDPFFDTPHQDALARESVLFENNFCTTPQCSPSRSSILTGLYPHKTGVLGNTGAAGGKALNQRTIGALLQDAGYYTAYFGKWHLGDRPVAGVGWNEGLGVEGERGNPQRDDAVDRRAAEFLNARRWGDKPFALFLSYVDPHDIYQFAKHPFDPAAAKIPLPKSWHRETFANKPPVHKQFMLEDQGKEIWGRPQALWEQYRDCYRAKVKIYDDYVGTVLDALKRQGLWDSTVLVNTSDHGDMDTQHRLIFKGPFMYDHMVRVPCLIRVPRALGGATPRRVRDLDVVNVDLFPTLLELAGQTAPKCDGLSLKPLLTGRGTQQRRDFVIGQYYSKQRWVNPIRMLRTAEFKYNRYLHWGEELYDLKHDPDELTNLAADPGYAKKKKELAAELDRWLAKNDDPFASLQPTTRAGKALT